MKYLEVGFVCVGDFLIGFFICAVSLMPHLPPYPPRPGSVFDGTMWKTNWVGVVLGVLLVMRQVRRMRRKGRVGEVG